MAVPQLEFAPAFNVIAPEQRRSRPPRRCTQVGVRAVSSTRGQTSAVAGISPESRTDGAVDGRDEASRLSAGQHIPGQCEWRWDGVSGESGASPHWAAMSARAELEDISASPPRNVDHLATDQVSGDLPGGHSPEPVVPP